VAVLLRRALYGPRLLADASRRPVDELTFIVSSPKPSRFSVC
jgi:hypothetical protein